MHTTDLSELQNAVKQRDYYEALTPLLPMTCAILEKEPRDNQCGGVLNPKPFVFVFSSFQHIFCEDCVSMWFDRERTCPMCRATVADDPRWRDGSTTMWLQFY